MPLSWNEIKNRAVQFSKEWEDETSEESEAKSFWDDFFNIFGISRRRVASFERRINKPDNTQGYADLLWKGVILIEHKSRGKDLDKANKQAIDYFPGLKESELPQYILVSDFARFRLYNLENDEHHEFELRELVNQVHFVIISRSTPLCEVPKIIYGSKPVDDGNFFLTDEEKDELIGKEPKAEKFIRPILSAKEFLNGKSRWVLWLTDISPAEHHKLPLVLQRVKNVKEFRQKSKKESVRKQADTPTLFSEIRQPKSNYIIIPMHSSENRKYIPMGFFGPDYIVSNSCTAIPDATLFHFGVLMSSMHMTWVRYVCGRIKGDYRYSNEVVYNNFPWPENPVSKNIQSVEQKAQKVLDIREEYRDSSLADLYGPDTMPPKLVKAHQDLDRAVDICYRSNPFVNDTKRIEFLFELYEKYDNQIFRESSKAKKRKK